MRAPALGGAGSVCQEATRDLARFSEFEEIAVAEREVAAAERVVAEIGDSRLTLLPFDANDLQQMLRTFPAHDAIVNGLPYQYDLPVN